MNRVTKYSTREATTITIRRRNVLTVDGPTEADGNRVSRIKQAKQSTYKYTTNMHTKRYGSGEHTPCILVIQEMAKRCFELEGRSDFVVMWYRFTITWRPQRAVGMSWARAKAQARYVSVLRICCGGSMVEYTCANVSARESTFKSGESSWYYALRIQLKHSNHSWRPHGRAVCLCKCMSVSCS